MSTARSTKKVTKPVAGRTTKVSTATKNPTKKVITYTRKSAKANPFTKNRALRKVIKELNSVLNDLPNDEACDAAQNLESALRTYSAALREHAAKSDFEIAKELLVRTRKAMRDADKKHEAKLAQQSVGVRRAEGGGG